jgi:hypothetical protein
MGRWSQRGRVVAVVLVTAAFAGLSFHLRDARPIQANPVGMQLDELEASGPCSAGRWPVKTLTDSRVAQVNLQPAATTISSLGALPRDSTISDSTARLEAETQTARISALLYADHLEDDLDIHLVVRDPAVPSNGMIVEFPDPRCTAAADPLLQARMTRARAAYVEACGPSSTAAGDFLLQGTGVVTGVRLFDTIVGQFGRAPNAIELHPVVGFTVTGACRKYGGAARFAVTSSIQEGSTLSGVVNWTATASTAAANITSTAFLVDNLLVSTTTRAASAAQTSFDTGTLRDGAHSFAVRVTLADGSTSMIVNHVRTSGGRPPVATPAMTLSGSHARHGSSLVISLRGFPPRSAVRITATDLGRRWYSRTTVVNRLGSGSAKLAIPLRAPLGKTTVAACDPGCSAIAVRKLAVGP